MFKVLPGKGKEKRAGHCTGNNEEKSFPVEGKGPVKESS